MKLRQWKGRLNTCWDLFRCTWELTGLFWVLFGLLGELFACFRELLAELEVIDDLFRYVLLFLEGGIDLHIKFCFLLPISHILHACKACSLVTCIGAEDSHIHQGILICPVGHPLLHRTIAKSIEQTTPFLSGRSESYMTFSAQMWDLLEEHAIAKLKFDPNRLRDWGTAWLLREKQTRGRL